MPAKGFRNSRKTTPTTLKTATALADPVLIRLSNASSHTLLLADVADYNHASEIHLQHVRWLRTRRSLASLLNLNRLHTGRLPTLTLQTSATHIATKIPTYPWSRVSASPPTFIIKHLTREQSLQLRATSPRRFATLSFPLTHLHPPRKTITRLARTTTYSALIHLRHLTPKRLALARI